MRIAWAPQLIGPVITFAAFTAVVYGTDKSLDTARMFTSLSLISLLTQPLSQTFQNIPLFMGSVQCLQRIQAFLLIDTKSGHRLMIQEYVEERSCFKDPAIRPGHDVIELKDLKESHRDLKSAYVTSSQKGESRDVIVIRNGAFGWTTSKKPILQDLNLTIKSSQLTMIIGPVACGKSTLLKALLGETPSSQGFVYVSQKEIAFCDQTPWLINASLQKNIIAFSDFDGPWYNSVVHACGLEEDLKTFPNGDHSLIGSKGITLSGGQKQRVVSLQFVKYTRGGADNVSQAIARAVFSRKKIIILDDVFSGMDAATESLVFARLLGPEGLLRKTGITCLFATHTGKLPDVLTTARAN